MPPKFVISRDRQRQALVVGGKVRAWYQLTAGGWICTAVAMLLCLLSLPAYAQDPSARDAEPGVSTTIIASAETSFSAETPSTKVRPAADITIDGPIAFGAEPVARAYTRLRLYGVPGASTVDPADVSTFDAASLNVGLYRRVGALSGTIWTSIVTEYGFTATRGTDPAPAVRYPRNWGAGIRLDDRSDGKWLQIVLGRAEIGGDWGYGQVQISGAVPLTLTKGAIVLGGDAVLSVGHPSTGVQHDVFRVWAGVDAGKLLAVARGKA